MQEPVSSAGKICKGLHHAIVLELQALAGRLEIVAKRLATSADGLRSALGEMQGQLQAAETRVTTAVDGAKRELILCIQTSESEQRNLLLQQRLNELQQQAAY